ncbi:hypothetical protein HXA31_19980 [Salipaludibacillus agaradhaerens]|jgi:hypothetical protein|uniref:DUF7667 family protein n=1 Tax=Salipaludibacillus TaxID=1884449 RepID=UPI0020D19558|nr:MULTISPECIES: hypothetical protein [Salipaludibacillus]MCR6116610.1 hypothetical protein [Salipaludibacillus agaradhaerens]UTR13452.1 hypothetical protein MM221_12525 [Salipaludibacillus sp. LMS25]
MPNPQPVFDRYQWLKQKQKFFTLTREERRDLKECEQFLEKYHRKLGLLETFFYMAYSTEDYEWLHEINNKIDKLKGELT